MLENLWDEEHGAENHLTLWLRFCESLGLDEAEVRASEPNTETRELVDGFRAACAEGSVAEGLATLYAYESQAPRVAETKIAGLQRSTASRTQRPTRSSACTRSVDVYHSQAERDVVVAAATTTDARAGLEEATRVAADRLWRFLDGAYAGAVTSNSRAGHPLNRRPGDGRAGNRASRQSGKGEASVISGGRVRRVRVQRSLSLCLRSLRRSPLITLFLMNRRGGAARERCAASVSKCTPKARRL